MENKTIEMMKIGYAIGLLLVLCSIAGCKEDPCEGYSNYIRTDERIKPYLFKEGSYWIYQNPVTQETDSEYVSGYYISLDTQTYHKYTCGFNYTISEVIYMIHENSLNPADSFIWKNHANTRGNLSVRNKGNSMLVFASDSREIPFTDCLFFDQQYPSLQIGQNNFKQVDIYKLDAYSTACANPFLYKTDLYFSPEIGVVRKKFYDTPDGTVEWNLVRWKIVQ
jgi:hypothetical protein